MTESTRPAITINSDFKAPFWLRNRHAQTLMSSLRWAWPEFPPLRRELLELPDGDVTAVDYMVAADSLPVSAPMLVILHGLEGSAGSSYARMLMQSALNAGWRSCVLHFRDCGDYRNRLPRRYHAGETSDLKHFLNGLQAQREGNATAGPLLAVGYSLGGNVLLKYLGECQFETPLSAATAVCVPFNLHISAQALNTGISKIYQIYLLKRMKNSVRRKFDQHTAAFDWDRAMNATTFAEFDDQVTAPLHGFDGMQDYYDKCSSIHYLQYIKRPTLIINALDDPFMTPDVIPSRNQLADSVTLELADNGGHVGFVSGGTPWQPNFYLPRRIVKFLEPFTAFQDSN